MTNIYLNIYNVSGILLVSDNFYLFVPLSVLVLLGADPETDSTGNSFGGSTGNTCRGVGRNPGKKGSQESI